MASAEVNECNAMEEPKILTRSPSYLDLQTRKGLTANRESLVSFGIPGVGYEPGVTLPLLGVRHHLDSVPNSVAVGIQVFNGTKHCFLPLKSDLLTGCLIDEAPCVAPGVVELFASRKNRPFSGTHGTLTWQIGETDTFFTIGWSVPYNRLLFDNWLMAGVTNEDPQRCFGQMYRKTPTWFQRKCFNEERNRSLKFSVKGYTITATMDWEYKSIASVTILPEDPEEISERIYNFAMAEV